MHCRWYFVLFIAKLHFSANTWIGYKHMYLTLTVDPFLSVQLQHTHFELEVSGDHLVQVDHKTMG